VSNILLGFFNTSQSVNLLQVVGVQLDWSLGQSLLFPLVWRQVARSFSDSLKGSFGEVTQSSGATFSGSVDICVSSVSQDLLWNWGCDDTGTSWSWDKSHVDGSALGVHFAWDSVRFTEFSSPVASSDRDDGELSEDDSRSDGVGDFFGAFYSETDMAVVVSDDDGGLESGSLTGSGLFLNWLDLENFVLKS
jgi:hypothetical protein